MKLIVNCHTFPPVASGGGGAVKYTQAVLRELGQRVDTTAIVSPTNKADFEMTGIKQEIVTELSGKHELFFSKDAVFFNPANKLTPTSLPEHLPIVSLIHDYQHLLRPEWHEQAVVASRNAEYGFEVLRSDLVICISEWELANLKKFYGAEHGRVIYHAPFLYEFFESTGRLDIGVPDLKMCFH